MLIIDIIDIIIIDAIDIIDSHIAITPLIISPLHY
jgi:hypothetical protein